MMNNSFIFICIAFVGCIGCSSSNENEDQYWLGKKEHQEAYELCICVNEGLSEMYSLERYDENFKYIDSAFAQLISQAITLNEYIERFDDVFNFSLAKFFERKFQQLPCMQRQIDKLGDNQARFKQFADEMLKKCKIVRYHTEYLHSLPSKYWGSAVCECYKKKSLSCLGKLNPGIEQHKFDKTFQDSLQSYIQENCQKEASEFDMDAMMKDFK